MYVDSSFGGPGIGHVLKGFINALSVHRNTKILIDDGYILGNYYDILDKSHIIYRSEMERYSGDFENLYTWRVMVTKEEELSIRTSSINLYKRLTTTTDLEHLNSPLIDPLFSPHLSIDYRYDRCILPHMVYSRIMKAVRSITFAPKIKLLAEKITYLIREPSLGVTVRTFQGPHEKKSDSTSKSDITLRMISRYMEAVIRQHKIKTVVLAFDDDQLKASMLNYLQAIGDSVSLLYPSDYAESHKLSHLEKAAVEVLSLSKTSFLLGLKNSSFVELAYYLGGMYQGLYFLPRVFIETSKMELVPLTIVSNSSCVALAKSVQACYRTGSRSSVLDKCIISEFFSVETDSQDLVRKDVILSPYIIKYLYPPSVFTPSGNDLWADSIRKQFCLDIQESRGGLANMLDMLNWHKKSPNFDGDLENTPDHKQPMNVRILCMIYTVEDKHYGAVREILKTWGRDCTGMLVFSNTFDASIPTVVVEQDGEDSYANLWRKIVAIWKYVNRNYVDEFDWFFLADDDTYLIYENLEV